MALRLIIIGAAAGGGVPQWNCNGSNSSEFWGREPSARLAPASQSSLAVSVQDGENADWALFNASPDIRSQIMATPALQPRDPEQFGLRDTPIRSVVLTNGDVDHIAGLLTLREKQAFTLWMTADIAKILEDNPIFDVLDPNFVTRKIITPETDIEILPGLSIRLFSVPGKVPLYMEEAGGQIITDQIGEHTVGVALSDGQTQAHYVPGCAKMTAQLSERLQGSALLLFDGTVFHDDEMPRQGIGAKTGKRMGHMSMAGAEGSMQALADVSVARKIYVHINNTNPVWRADSEERAMVTRAGWEIAHDGMEIVL